MAPLSLILHTYLKSVEIIRTQINEGRGNTAAASFHLHEEGGTGIGLLYRKLPSPRPPTYQDLANVFGLWIYITTFESRPEPNPLFSRETRFALAVVDGETRYLVARGVLSLVETGSGLLASN